MSLATPVTVALKSNPEILGTMVDLQVIPMNGEIVVKAAVAWEHPSMLTPCPSFHSPDELVNFGCPVIESLFDDDDDDEAESEESESVETHASDEPEGL